MVDKGNRRPSVFISYSHKDERWKDLFVTQMGVLEKEGLLDVWVDTRIGVGEDWQPRIEHALNRCSVAVLLVTANFLTSDFILREEIPRLLQRRATEGVRVFPIIVMPCPWKKVGWLSRMQVRPKNGVPVGKGSKFQQTEKIAAIAEEVADIIKRAGVGTRGEDSVQLPPDSIFTAKLPTTNPELFGREDRLRLLDEEVMTSRCVRERPGPIDLGEPS